MRFLVIGCGSIGQRHIRNLISMKAGEILAYDTRSDRQREVASQFEIETPPTLEEAWGQGPDAVLVAAPTSLHVPLALDAAKNRCHLFIEKPLSDRLDGVEQLQDVIRDYRLVSLVGCNMRFHPGLQKVKSLVEQDAVGRVVAGRADFGHYLPEWHPGEDYRHLYSARRNLGGGVILDAIHEIDYIRWLLGEVESVACFAGKVSGLEIETEDMAAILLRFASGAIGEVHLDYVQRVYNRSCRIIGTEGTISWDYSAGEARWYSAKTGLWEVFTNRDWEPNQMYLDEMRHFVSCVEGKQKSMMDVVEASTVLKVALAAGSSAKTGIAVKV